MTRTVAEALPLQFAGMHRYVPCYAKLAGYSVRQTAVLHHPRVAGKSKYGFYNRVTGFFTDVLVLRWMSRRLKTMRWEEVQPPLPRRSTESEASFQSQAASYSRVADSE